MGSQVVGVVSLDRKTASTERLAWCKANMALDDYLDTDKHRTRNQAMLLSLAMNPVFMAQARFLLKETMRLYVGLRAKRSEAKRGGCERREGAASDAKRGGRERRKGLRATRSEGARATRSEDLFPPALNPPAPNPPADPTLSPHPLPRHPSRRYDKSVIYYEAAPEMYAGWGWWWWWWLGGLP